VLARDELSTPWRAPHFRDSIARSRLLGDALFFGARAPLSRDRRCVGHLGWLRASAFPFKRFGNQQLLQSVNLSDGSDSSRGKFLCTQQGPSGGGPVYGFSSRRMSREAGGFQVR
jgi:hypothetical protein